MIFHNNERCPVCDKLFNESDDIVICPHCATPHHRACYNQLGHCANKDKHRDGFDYRAEHKQFAEQQSDSASEEKTQQSSGSKKRFAAPVAQRLTNQLRFAVIAVKDSQILFTENSTLFLIPDFLMMQGSMLKMIR